MLPIADTCFHLLLPHLAKQPKKKKLGCQWKTPKPYETWKRKPIQPRRPAVTKLESPRKINGG
jgi:hypothetical protein